LFDPALKHHDNAFRLGDPVFTDNFTAYRWRAARRQAMHLALRAVAMSSYVDHLVLRGSLLLKAWVGRAAREPGDMDWVVAPQDATPSTRWVTELLGALPRMIQDKTAEQALHISAGDAVVDDIWSYERAPGRRLVIPWQVDDLPAGVIQMDFVFNEPLWTSPESIGLGVE
jgi:hypothetical protein